MSKKSKIAFLDLSSLKSIGFSLSLAGNSLIVGNPSMTIPSISFLVASILAIKTFGFLFNYIATSSYIGSKALQCSHQGA